MTKSKKRSSNRRRHGRNRKKSESLESSSIKPALDVDNIDIEAQLERQRRKRALSKEEACSKKLTSPKFLGGYEYDEESKTYFPKGSKTVRPRKDLISKNDVKINSRSTATVMNHFSAMSRSGFSIEKTPTAWIEHLVATCTIPDRSRALRELWSGRVMISTMSITSSMQRLFDSTSNEQAGWVSMLPQLKCSSDNRNSTPGVEAPWDIACKSSLHSASRTFDIQLGPDKLQFPRIVSLVDGGIFGRVHRGEPLVWNEERYMGTEWRKETFFDLKKESHSVRFLPPLSTDHLDVVRLTSKPSRDIEIFRVGLSQIGVCYVSRRLKVESSFDINDITSHPSFGRGSALLSLATRVSRNSKELVLCYDVEKETSLKTQIGKYPKSDALCLEHLDENTVLFGHRNGAISLLDVRNGAVHKVSSADQNGGSTKSLLPLACGNIFIAKKLFGDCHVFDLRKTEARRNDDSLRMIWNLVTPVGIADRMLSSCCTGIAVDPSEKVVISPFSDHNRLGHVGFWSLTSGRLIGSKAINTLASAQSGSRTNLPHCELRSTVTPSWKIDTSQRKHCVTSCKNSWSLWFKSWEVEPNAPHCMGSIHQLTFPGKVFDTHF